MGKQGGEEGGDRAEQGRGLHSQPVVLCHVSLRRVIPGPPWGAGNRSLGVLSPLLPGLPGFVGISRDLSVASTQATARLSGYGSSRKELCRERADRPAR